jgi:predicted phosphohydrolase
MRGVKCVYCGNEINAFELATVSINGKKRYCHSQCYLEEMNKTQERILKRELS